LRALILGKGVSGRGAAELLEKLKIGFEYYEDGDRPPELSAFDFAVKSPGFPPGHRLVRRVREELPLYGEVELAYRFMRGKIVGITGTNGKSTTTAMVYRCLEAAGRKAFIGGNYGVPASSFALETTPTSVSVLELSSFQIEDLTSFRGDVGAIINVTPDHLDRYPSFRDYLAAKLKIVNHFDFMVINGDDLELSGLKGDGFVRFSLKGRGDFRFDGTSLAGDGFRVEVGELPLKGLHNLENYLCAVAVLRLLGLEEEEIVRGLKEFRGLPHRTEFVGAVGGVRFINDSKSTNVDSVKKALLSFDKVVLIAGGKDKGLDFTSLAPIIKERVKAVVAIGEATSLIEKSFSGLVPVRRASSMDEAVETAFYLAEGEGVVLLSPGCASFDMFRNYKERGEAFKRAVKRLEESFA